jgi:hypothetical protein
VFFVNVIIRSCGGFQLPWNVVRCTTSSCKEMRTATLSSLRRVKMCSTVTTCIILIKH